MKEFNRFYVTHSRHSIEECNRPIFFGPRTNNVVFIFLIVIAIMHAVFTSTAFAERSTSSPQPEFPLASNHNNHVIGRAADNLYIRSENHLGCNVNKSKYDTEEQINEYEKCIDNGLFFSEDKELVLPAQSKGFVDLPKMASKFLVDNDNTSVAVTFSALIDNNSTFDSPFLIRVLVDGQVAEPDQITLLGGYDNPFTPQAVYNPPSVQSFTFLTNVDKGIHTVQIQYSTTAIDLEDSFLRNATLRINTEIIGIFGKKTIENHSTTWIDVPGSDMKFVVPEDGKAAITFSSVVRNEPDNNIWLKAIIDDGLVEPYPKDILLAERLYKTEARSVIFTAQNLTPGEHSIRFQQSNIKPETIAQLKVWSVLINSKTQKDGNGFFDIVLQSEISATNSSEYQPIPGLETEILVDEVSDIAVTLSGFFSGTQYAFATVTLDGVPLVEHEVSMHKGIWHCLEPDKSGFSCAKASEIETSGARSYTFGLKNLPPRNTPYKVGMVLKKWSTNVLGFPGEGINFDALISDSIMVVDSKLRVGPDLAVGPNMGRGSKKFETIIEPIYGKRKLLTIIIDPIYISEPVSPKFIEETDEYIYGDSNSVIDYYKVISNNRLQIEKAGIFGPYLADYAGVISNGNNYYHDDYNFGCDNGKEFKSGGDALHAEAILRADNEVDFSQFDLNNDGTIVPSELGIIIAIPAGSNKGSTIGFKPYCKDSNKKLIVDGVEITEVVHFNVMDTNSGEETDKKMSNMMTGAHELGHHFLGLDDMSKGDIFTNPGVLSLMDNPINLHPTVNAIESTAHLDAFQKLHLGWARPIILESNKKHTLHDIKNKEDTFILPRRQTDSREYIVLESRFNSDSFDAVNYDYNIKDSGLAVYHITEPDDSCKTNYKDFESPLDAAPNCKPLQKPICMTDEIWLGGLFSNFIRTGFRLISPDLSHQDSDGWTDYAESLFGVSDLMEDVNLLDDGSFSCPEKIGAPLPYGSLPPLLWSDGKASGYKLYDIEIDFNVNKTTFDLIIN